MNPSSKAFPTSLSPEQLVAVEHLRARFAQLPDSRMPGRVMIVLCSILSDNDAFTDMEAFAKSQLGWLRTLLPLESGAPSHDVFIEQLWRSLKYEKLRLWSYQDMLELEGHIDWWMGYYNHRRKHQHLDYATPWSLYRPAEEGAAAA